MKMAFAIFFITLFFIIFQPFGIKVGFSAVAGAVVAFISGCVSLEDIFGVWDMVWDATLTLVGIIILSLGLDEIGFFEWCAIKFAKLSNGKTMVMFVSTMIFGALVSAFFANDGAVLILTPILLAKVKALKMGAKEIFAFVMAGGFISDFASLPFVFSNLTNILSANFFDIGFGQYFGAMIMPFCVSVVASILVLWLVFRKDLSKNVDLSLLPNENKIIKNRALFAFSWVFLALLFLAYFLSDHFGVPISIFALGGGLLFLMIANLSKCVNSLQIMRAAPWGIVWFSLGLYVVVYGLKNANLAVWISEILSNLAQYGELVSVLGTGFISAFLSAFMNNLPTVMIMNISLENLGSQMMIYANIIGSNLGPKMTPFGSLATLLWIYVLSKKGVKISFWQYTKFGLIVTPPVLLATLFALFL
ncbi:arsenic transporter [Campylobacter iguaniorum]|uniref:arsenic transporter n=1 Tax=Campylobacter iguaniorum TaxID=1244531 RepID=UPI0007C8ECDC|nr:arsenic transporter [Campylobacter iguaniorum]